jgi:membrane protein DedA with SNARE-associated domain
VNNFPFVLVGISPLSRHIILVAPLVDPLLLLIVGGTRTLAFTTLSFWLGRTLGESALTWLDQRSKGASRIVRMMERFFRRWSYFAVFLLPLGAMACIAGVARMRPTGFFAVAIPGILFRLSLYAWFGESLREPILSLLGFIRIYQAEATVFLILGIGSYQLFKRRVRRSV